MAPSTPDHTRDIAIPNAVQQTCRRPSLKPLEHQAADTAYGLPVSPIGQLDWIVNRFREWSFAAEVPEDAVDRDKLLTNVTIY